MRNVILLGLLVCGCSPGTAIYGDIGFQVVDPESEDIEIPNPRLDPRSHNSR